MNRYIIDTNKEIPFQQKNNQDIKIIGDYDKTMLNYIGRLYKDLNGDTIDIDNLENVVDVLSKYKNKLEYSYLENLIHPEQAKGCKIPSPIPVPSTSFQLHNSITLTTNNKGNLAIVFNPFYLYNINDLGVIGEEATAAVEPRFFSTFYVNNSDSLDGISVNNAFTPVNIGQGIPNVYDQYRLVSASLIVKYIGRMDITSGVIGGAIVFDENQQMGAGGTLEYENRIVNVRSKQMWLEKYGNFDLAMDSFYHQENLCLEGLRMLYFPIDNTFEEYTKLADSSITNARYIPYPIDPTRKIVETYQIEDYNKSGFNWMIYVLGAPPSSSCFKLDIYLNFECLPNASFLNYIPITPLCQHINQIEKKESIEIIRKKPIMKYNEIINRNKNKWNELKKYFNGILPSKIIK